MKKFLRYNGLSIVLFLLFALFLLGQSVAGHRHFNEEQGQHGQPPVGYGTYLVSADFMEAVFENWESEFLQMGLFVILTALLFQKGSAESNELPGERAPAKPINPRKIPHLARIRGFGHTLYEHSLSGALLLLFLFSFGAHAASGCRAYNEEQVEHGGEAIGLVQYMGTSQFWFESFQNWQSEFLSIGLIVVLSIFLREKGSSQSKEVEAPHAQTGV